MAEASARSLIRRKVAGDLGLLIEAPYTRVDADTATVDHLADVTPNPEIMRDAFFYVLSGSDAGEWSRITGFNYPTNNNVDLAVGILADVTADLLSEIYFMLDLDNWNRVVNEALTELWRWDRQTIPLIANTDEYALASWIQTSGQIGEVLFRDTNPSPPLEGPVPAWTLQEDDNVLTLKILQLPAQVTNVNIVVKARRYYAELATDAATTTCPLQLITQAGVLKAAEKIFKTRGRAMRDLFGQTLIVAQKKLDEQKADHMPKIIAREFVHDGDWNPTRDFELTPGW
jgi:hypothetical protein